MMFGRRPVRAAKGTILARSVSFKAGGRLDAGCLLGPTEIAALVMAGVGEVTVAELDPHDVAQDEVARRVSAAMVPLPSDANLDLGRPSAGAVQITATCAGVLGLDTAGITRMNRVDEGVAVATLPQFHRVAKGDVVATVRVIPYGVKRSALSKVIEDAHDTIRVRAVLAETASLIQTVIGGDGGAAKGEAFLRVRLDRLGVHLIETLVVPHREEALAEALLSARGEVVFVLTAVETVDRGDVAPEAVKQAGGVITRFGLPVDPGARFFAGGLGAVPILGLPGGARDPAMTGVDRLVDRLLCGVSITDEDIAQMGVGGLSSSDV
ncbi:molybdopterin biosynthesis protein [Celeribacter baekdonensis]|nr:molybdopterin biosynthesis protein [Celeribacter baekdonensis]